MSISAFSAPTRAWFEAAFAEPTRAQSGAWEAIASGEHALVVAPTGSGKTLAAFLWAIDRLSGAEGSAPADPAASGPATSGAGTTRVLYISPLKALAADIERNLRSPLVGIERAAAGMGRASRDIRVGMRTGDTPAVERRRLVARPPDILITTPESLFLMLTSGAQEALRGVETVIVDEIHAVAGSKRGAHLALSLERLDALLERPAQRIGLSATVRPAEVVSSFLAGARSVKDGGRPVRIVRPETRKELHIDVTVPVEDLSDPRSTPLRAELEAPQPRAEEAAGPSTPLNPTGLDLSGNAGGTLPEQRAPSIWPHLTEQLVDLIAAHRSTIVFTNGRRTAERLAAWINEEWERRAGIEVPDGASSWPASMPGQSGTAAASAPGGDPAARVHHGSMSREERLIAESALKAGQLRAVVATSSLELGIDMGAVDLVVQIGAPPSVASALQRIGRAGHQVGAASHGVVLPTHRGELLAAAETSRLAAHGEVEAVRVPTTPLDVLAQHIVAMVAVEDLTVDELAARIRRACPYRGLGDRSLTAVLDMLAGRYPSEDFAELRPRLVWDREQNTLSARPGAARLAVTSGGTIPDRGLYGVFLATAAPAQDPGDPEAAQGEASAAPTPARRGGRRVGELDEEMVYESRVGDTIILGTSSWRIEEITPDRVLVSPAPGQAGRLPFWHGDSPGRPAELGRRLGARMREFSAGGPDDWTSAAGLDERARANLHGYLAEQQAATGQLPDDRTIVVERFRDELGDWRVVIHSPLGRPVLAPWAMVLTARLRDLTGMDVQVMPADDGIVLRLPDLDGGASVTGGDDDLTRAGHGTAGGQGPLSAETLLLDPSEVSEEVVAALAGSAHFAARFRQAAARSLLLPRRRPDRRQPLWQQRHRSAQLLSVAAAHPDFPVVHEAVRECLQDDFDVPALTELMAAISRREIRLVDVTTTAPSPFARSLLLGYTGQFIYDGDTPLAERRAAALSLDSTLLAELLGGAAGDLADLLDPEAVTEVAAAVGLRSEQSLAKDAEALFDLIRRLGPITMTDLAVRCAEPDQLRRWLTELHGSRRIIEIRVAGEDRWAALEDSARLRDAVGVALPPGLPEAVLAGVADPLGDLIRRFARTNGPFRPSDVAAWLGLPPATVMAPLEDLVRHGTLTSGRLDPRRASEPAGSPGQVTGRILDYCDTAVLRRIRRRSLTALRAEVEPVEARALGVFLPRWQQVAPVGTSPNLRGADGVAAVIDQLAGSVAPASAWESLILPARVRNYEPGLLDELSATGEVVWAGAGTLPGSDGLIALLPAGAEELLGPAGEVPDGQLHRDLIARLSGGGGHFYRDLIAEGAVGNARAEEVAEALWDLVWAGLVTNDTLAPLRTRLAGSSRRAGSRAAPRARAMRRGRMRPAGATAPPAAGGRWSIIHRPAVPADHARPGVAEEQLRTEHATALTGALLDRHGLVVRGASGIERLGFGTAYQVLRTMEESGQVRRGYLVEGLGAAQFALPEVVDRLRADAAASLARRESGAEPQIHLLAATDPGNPYGAALPWPAAAAGEGHRPGRKSGAVVILAEGDLVAFLERGGRSLLTFTTEETSLVAAARTLAGAAGRLGGLTIRRIDGTPALEDRSVMGQSLRAAGFTPAPQGLRMRP